MTVGLKIVKYDKPNKSNIESVACEMHIYIDCKKKIVSNIMNVVIIFLCMSSVVIILELNHFSGVKYAFSAHLKMHSSKVAFNV